MKEITRKSPPSRYQYQCHRLVSPIASFFLAVPSQGLGRISIDTQELYRKRATKPLSPLRTLAHCFLLNEFFCQSASLPSDSGFLDSLIPNLIVNQWVGFFRNKVAVGQPVVRSSADHTSTKRPYLYSKSKGEHLVFRFDPYSAPLMKGSVPLSIQSIY